MKKLNITENYKLYKAMRDAEQAVKFTWTDTRKQAAIADAIAAKEQFQKSLKKMFDIISNAENRCTVRLYGYTDIVAAFDMLTEQTKHFSQKEKDGITFYHNPGFTILPKAYKNRQWATSTQAVYQFGPAGKLYLLSVKRESVDIPEKHFSIPEKLNDKIIMMFTSCEIG